MIMKHVPAVAGARQAEGDGITAVAKALEVSRATLYRHLSQTLWRPSEPLPRLAAALLFPRPLHWGEPR